MECGVVWLDDGDLITLHRVVPGWFEGVWELWGPEYGSQGSE